MLDNQLVCNKLVQIKFEATTKKKKKVSTTNLLEQWVQRKEKRKGTFFEPEATFLTSQITRRHKTPLSPIPLQAQRWESEELAKYGRPPVHSCIQSRP